MSKDIYMIALIYKLLFGQFRTVLCRGSVLVNTKLMEKVC